MSDVLTTKDNFPVIDITHKPKRTQAGNIQLARGANETPDSLNTGNTSNVPQTVTIERAITFYESNADGEYKNLYLQTAKWLREFMSKTVPVSVETVTAEVPDADNRGR